MPNRTSPPRGCPKGRKIPPFAPSPRSAWPWWRPPWGWARRSVPGSRTALSGGAPPEVDTWYLATNLPRPGSPRAAEGALAPAELAEVVRLYGLRNWVEQSYKQAKHEWGWADFQVRGDVAIRRHGEWVCCAFCFCWWARRRSPNEPATARPAPEPGSPGERRVDAPEPHHPVPPAAAAVGGKRRAGSARHPAGQRTRDRALLAGGAAPGAELAFALAFPRAVLAGVGGFA